jgi:hypothetical protein
MNTLIVYVFLTCSTLEYFCELESRDDNNNNNNISTTKNKNNSANNDEDDVNNISINNNKITITAKPYSRISLQLLEHTHIHSLIYD